MGVKYVKDFSFPSSGGFHGDVQRYAKGGHVTKMPAKAKASAKDMPARAKPNAPAKGAPKMASKPAVGKRQGYDKGGRVPGREMDRLPTKRPPGRMKDLAPARPFKGKYEGYANGGPVDEILPGDGRGGLEAVPMPEAMPGSPGNDRTYVKPIWETLGMTREQYLNQAGGPAAPTMPMKPMDNDGGRNDFLYELLRRDTQRMRGDAARQMRDMQQLGIGTAGGRGPEGDNTDYGYAKDNFVGILPTMPPEELPEFLRPELQQTPVRATTPLPEEPVYARPAPYTGPTVAEEDPNRYREMIADMQRATQQPPMLERIITKEMQPGYIRPRADNIPPVPVAPPRSASAPRMERPEPIGLASLMPGAPVSRPPIAGEPGFGTSKGVRPLNSDALRRQMAAVKSGMDLQGTRGVKGSPLAEAARRAAVQGRAGVREDMGRRPAAAPAPKASRNAILRALASRMKAPAPVSRARSEVLPVNPAALPVFKKGGEVKGKKIAKVMGEYKAGKLHSGSKKGPKVTSEKQAMAIALSEARKAGAKIPKKAEGGIFNDEYMAYESKGPKTRYSAARSRRESKERAMERRALDKARHAEKYAPGMSLDMPDRKKHGGMPVHRRKPMYGGGKC